MGVPVTMIVALLLLDGCASMAGADGRYATPRRGGWDSFRAAASVEPDHLVANLRPLIGSRFN